MSEAKKYDRSYKEQPVKLALETGVKRAVEELKVPYGTLYGWMQAAKNGDLDIEERPPKTEWYNEGGPRSTEVKAKNGKLYVSAIFDCYDLTAVGLSMDDNMRAELCTSTVENTAAAYPEFCSAVLHSE